jgi:hypothetical protein
MPGPSLLTIELMVLPVSGRFKAGKDDQKWFYRGCVAALHGCREPIYAELEAAVRQLEQL